MMFKNLHDKFVLKVKWMFHYLGFIIEKIPDENKIFSDLKNTHEAVQKHVLKRLTKNIRIANNHVLYNNLLKKCVPDWNSDFTSAMFIGNGVGEFSLDTFRKVYLGENRFAHASSSRGVVISNLNEPYYSRYFYKGGRIIEPGDKAFVEE